MKRSLLLLSCLSIALFFIGCDGEVIGVVPDTTDTTLSDTTSNDAEAVIGNEEERIASDFVTSVKLDGVELTGSVNIQKFPRTFWAGGLTKYVVISGCIPGGEIHIDYKNKAVSLEIYKGENININQEDWDKIFADEKSDLYREYPLEALVYISWSDMRKFTESLSVDGKLIKPDLTFDEFKRTFPVSAAHGEEAYNDADRELSGAYSYSVMIGENARFFEMYSARIVFVFKDGKLLNLSILQTNNCS
jgi:hypothetical protein